MSVPFFRIGATLCFLAVALGAFGAHSLKATLQAHETAGIWEKAVLYHFLHAIALLILALHAIAHWAPAIFFIAGIVLFCGSLYFLALTNMRWLGAITPLGGLCFLAGWAWFAISAAR